MEAVFGHAGTVNMPKAIINNPFDPLNSGHMLILNFCLADAAQSKTMVQKNSSSICERENDRSQRPHITWNACPAEGAVLEPGPRQVMPVAVTPAEPQSNQTHSPL